MKSGNIDFEILAGLGSSLNSDLSHANLTQSLI